MIHGLPGSIRDYRYLAAALANRARIIRIELPGFGETPASTGRDTTITARGQMALSAIEALGFERFLVVGHSMGGTVATHVAVNAASRVTGLGLLSSVGMRLHKMLRRFPAGAFKPLVDLPVLGGGVRRLMRAGLIAGGFSPQTTLDDAAQSVRVLGALDLDTHRHNVRALNVPTLLAWAEDDAFIEPAIFREFAPQLPAGPRLTWPRGGHNIQKSHAVEIADALAAMLS